MSDILDEEWGRTPAEKPPAPTDAARREDRRWELIFECVLGFLFFVIFVPVLIGWLQDCWRFWSAVALWCVGPGRGFLCSPGSAVPWLLCAVFAGLACLRHAGRGGRT